MHAAVIKTVPTGAFASLAEAAEESLAAVWIEHVVLAGYEEHRQRGLFQYLGGVIEFFISGELRHITGVNDEVGPDRKRPHFCDRLAEGRSSIRVRRLCKADVAVAQLDKGKGPARRWPKRCCKGALEPDRTGDPSIEGKECARSGPGHALEKIASFVVIDLARHRWSFR